MNEWKETNWRQRETLMGESEEKNIFVEEEISPCEKVRNSIALFSLEEQRLTFTRLEMLIEPPPKSFPSRDKIDQSAANTSLIACLHTALDRIEVMMQQSLWLIHVGVMLFFFLPLDKLIFLVIDLVPLMSHKNFLGEKVKVEKERFIFKKQPLLLLHAIFRLSRRENRC